MPVSRSRFTRPTAVNLTIALVALLVLAAPRPAAAAAPSLDPEFGSGGITGQLLLAGNRFGSVTATTTQPDGKVLLAGRAYGTPASTQQRGTILRLNANGTLDTSFGEGGRVFLPDTFNCQSCSDAALNAIAIDSLGRILLAGQGSVGGVTSATAVRLTPLGALDSSFGGTGMVRLGGAESQGLGIAADSGDGVLIGTASGFFHTENPGVTRLTPTGVVDVAGFGVAGTTSLAAGGVLGAAVTPVDLAPLPSGFAVIGTTQEKTTVTGGGMTSTGGAAVVRAGATGTVSSFTRIRPAGDPASAIYPDAFAVSGGATAAGAVYLSGLSALKRDKGGGGTEFDYSASGSGVFIAAAPAAGSPTVAVLPGTSGPTSLPGDVAADGADGFAMLATVASKYEIVGFDAALAPDLDYGAGGVLPFPGFGQVADVAGSLAFDAQHRLVVSGGSANGASSSNKDFGALRLTAEPAPPGGGKEEAGGGGGTGGSSPVPSPSAPAPAAKVPPQKKKVCAKGFKKKKKVRGKSKCVKKKAKGHR